MTLQATNCTTSGTTLTISGSVTGGAIVPGMVVTWAAQSVLTAITLLTGGSAYDGGGSATFTNVAASYNGGPTAGTGSGLTVNVTVTAGVVTAVAINSTASAVGYQKGETLTVSNTLLGGTGSGFQFTVSAGGLPVNTPVTVVSGASLSWVLSATIGVSGITLTFESTIPQLGARSPEATIPIPGGGFSPAATIIGITPPQPLPQTLIGSTSITSFST